MILLAIDTSGKDGGITLACVDDSARGPDALAVVESTALEGGTFSAQLVPQIAGLLAKHGLTKSDIGAFAVASGPGSFTGLRVGLAAVKALAEVLERPIAAVSRLEAVARAGRSGGRVFAALDAGRGELYVGEYDIGTGRMIDERVQSQGEFLALARGAKVVTPESAWAGAALAAGAEVEEVVRPGSEAVARIGWEKIRVGETISTEALEANYIRRSDAEIFAKRS
jgi:tRNA threonylcarbamoyladenosine biosynthesis protein TsaB